jgi:hypothetical protein
MQYKLDLAGQPQLRPHGLYEFRNCLRSRCERESSGGGQAHPWINTETGADDGAEASLLFSTVRSGDILVEDVKIEHLLGHSSMI